MKRGIEVKSFGARDRLNEKTVHSFVFSNLHTTIRVHLAPPPRASIRIAFQHLPARGAYAPALDIRRAHKRKKSESSRTEDQKMPASSHLLALHRLQIFMGPMWSGKTNRLIQAVDAARLGYTAVNVVRFARDTRAPPGLVVARTGLALAATHSVVDLAAVPLDAGGENSLFAVDEAQFFGDGLVEFWRRLAPTPHGLIVAGLDLDFARRPFGSVLRLARDALDFPGDVLVERLTATCDHRDAASGAVCGRRAPYSQRLSEGGSAQVLVGGSDFYAPACERHHVPEPVPRGSWGKVGR
jgi:thymidine kinase